MEKITQKAGSNGQFLVRYKSAKEGSEICKWLEERGYCNKFGLDFERRVQVIVVNKGRDFFGTNVTCMAAAVSCGIEIIDFNRLKELL